MFQNIRNVQREVHVTIVAMSNSRVVLVGGGSGGHFYPLMAIAESLRSDPGVPQLYYFGPNEYDANALTQNNIRFVYCPAGKRRRYHSVLNMLDVGKTLYGVFVAIIQLFLIYPDVVMSKGGFTSVPVTIAARFLRIPVVIHESDATPGKANKLAGKFAKHVAISYEETAKFFSRKPTTVTGAPIRKELLAPPSMGATATLGLDESKPTILVLGGSQGAERVNQLIVDSLDELLPHYNIIHQTGKQNFDVTLALVKELITDATLLNMYRPVPFLESTVLNQAMHAATLIISRAGSGTIHEIAVHGKPSILIPIPEEISHDQRTNAYTYARKGATIVIEEANLKDGLIASEIERIIGDSKLYTEMSAAAASFGKTDASETIANILLGIIKLH